VLAIREPAFGPGSVEVADVLQNLAGFYRGRDYARFTIDIHALANDPNAYSLRDPQ